MTLPKTDNAALDSRLSFLVTCDQMKNILRRTMLADYSRRENDAEHSWHLSLTAMVLAPYMPEPFDMGHVLALCTAHDLVEIYAGDTFAYDVAGNQDKLAREEAAATKLFGMLPQEQGEEFYLLWKEFDACQTSEARLANAADRIQPFLNNVVTMGHTWRLGQVTRAQVLARTGLVFEVLPALKPFVLRAIDEAQQKGWILPDAPPEQD
jgi:putative hydrolase of HD superfamily